MSDTEESPHFDTCTHRADGVILTKDAEQVAVFWDPRRNIFHYSIRVGDWYGCKVVTKAQFEEMDNNPAKELKFIQSEANFLKSLHQ